jgi:hypothetical protein
VTLDSALIAKQQRLKQILQDEIKEGDFERLVASLVSRMLDVGIAMAKHGFQFGGDAGPSGREGRRFRIETKRYADSTSLSHRELLGEVDHALQRDGALEGWFLAATKRVSEQLETDLLLHGETHGVPIVVIDCKVDDDVWSLTALCTVNPAILDTLVSKEAGNIARDFVAPASGQLQRLRRECEAWQLGFETLRKVSHAELERIWSSPRAAIAKLGQDAAGGSRPNRVPRRSVSQALDAWWSGAAAGDAPAAVLGLDGVGKTWASLDWLVGHRDHQPAILVIPASVVAGARISNAAAVRRLLAEQVHALTNVRSIGHWVTRLERLFQRPAAEGPLLTLMLDGLNQVSGVPWIDLIRILQDDAFAGRLRLIVTTRNYHFEEKLRSLRGLAVLPTPIEVGVYDDTELDAMLAFEHLQRQDLHPELVALARRPRLFALVVKFRDRLVEAGSITPHRLLWEYGKDTLGPQGGRSFTEREWREWLQKLAQNVLDNTSAFTTQSLADSAARPDLSESDVFARMSDLIDGSFLNTTSRGYEATPAVVAHALGLALLVHLDGLAAGADYEGALNNWLDAISGLDERAEILRASVSIMVARGGDLPEYAKAILLAWLQSQNIPDTHLADLIGLARPLAEHLLGAIEISAYVHRSARLWAVNALRSLPRDDAGLRDLIVAKAAEWLRVVSRDIDTRNANSETEKSRIARLSERIGVDRAGPLTVLGTPIELVDQASKMAPETIPSLIEGFPLEHVLPVFEAAAIAFAIRHRDDIWESLKWLILLNEVDRPQATAAIRARASAIAAITPEPGVHPDVALRVAALLLWLNSTDEDSGAAAALHPALYRVWDYDSDYLVDPGASFFALERRHATSVLENTSLALFSRLNRSRHLWLDPTFTPPPSVIDELVVSVANFPANELDADISPTEVDLAFDQNAPLLARGAPEALAAIVRTKLAGLGSQSPSSRYWVAARIREHTILWDASSVSPAQQLRQSSRQPDASEECYAASSLVMVEVLDLPPLDQVQQIVAAGLGNDLDFEEIVGELTAHDVDKLIARFGSADAAAIDNLMALLLITQAPLSDSAWNWLLPFAFGDIAEQRRTIVFHTLTQFDPKRLGRELIARDWSWQPGGEQLCNHYGSLALAEAADAIPFDQLAMRLAPWLLLHVARKRGQSPSETVLAAQLLDNILRPTTLDLPEIGSQIVIYLERREEQPFAFSLLPPPPEDNGDPAQRFQAMMDTEGRQTARRRAVETALARIRQAHETGADLFLASFQSSDLRTLFREAPDLIDGWTAGASDVTADFKRRVLRAEGFYIALCEAALEERPDLGSILWRALQATGALRVLGRSHVPELVHIPFRVRQTPQSEQILDELLELPSANTDKDLFDLGLAATINGRTQWLEDVIARDAASTATWRRMRAETMSGFGSGYNLPIDDAWPEGELTAAEHRRNQSAKWRLSEASTRHWLNAYLHAPDEASANAAWILFMQCADRRALQRLRTELPAWRTRDRLQRLKRAHAIFNLQVLERAIEKREKPLSENFLGRKIVRGISPWN